MMSFAYILRFRNAVSRVSSVSPPVSSRGWVCWTGHGRFVGAQRWTRHVHAESYRGQNVADDWGQPEQPAACLRDRGTHRACVRAIFAPTTPLMPHLGSGGTLSPSPPSPLRPSPLPPQETSVHSVFHGLRDDAPWNNRHRHGKGREGARQVRDGPHLRRMHC